MTIACVIQPSEDSQWFGWDEVSLRDLEGNEIDYLPMSHYRPIGKWAEVVAMDDDLGLYVLTDGSGRLFTCQSIDLDFEEE